MLDYSGVIELLRYCIAKSPQTHSSSPSQHRIHSHQKQFGDFEEVEDPSEGVAEALKVFTDSPSHQVRDTPNISCSTYKVEFQIRWSQLMDSLRCICSTPVHFLFLKKV